MTSNSHLEVRRNGTVLHVGLKGLSNHELREILVGLWATLDDNDRKDHIRELQHYERRGLNGLSPMAQGIADGATS